jgi:hypothetical protein
VPCAISAWPSWQFAGVSEMGRRRREGPRNRLGDRPGFVCISLCVLVGLVWEDGNV